MATMYTGPKHPMVAYGERRNWNYEKTAAHFGVSYPEFRQLVTGWTCSSYIRAKDWAVRSAGEFSVTDVMEWQIENRRREVG